MGYKCLLNLFIMMLCVSGETVFQTKCPLNLVGDGNIIFVIYQRERNINEAKNICSNFKGVLAETSDSKIKNELINQAISLLLPRELVSVSIFRNPSNRNRLKYRANVNIQDNTNIQKWKQPPKGNLRSFRLYTKNTLRFFQRVRFCFVFDRDSVRIQCNQGWYFNFDLFGGSAKTKNTITLYNYNYFISRQFSTILSLKNDLRLRNGDTGKLHRDPNPNVTVYIPDISLFIGAQSNVNQTNWYWNNGTMVNNPMFPTSNKSVCQEMTWPLTYDDGINLRPKKCNRKSHFICQINFAIEAIRYRTCSGYFLYVFWNQSDFFRGFVKSNDFYLEINNMEFNISRSVSFNQYEALIELQRDQTFNEVQATLRIRYCSTFKVTSKVAIQTDTSFLNGNLVNLTFSNCVLEWYYKPKNTSILFYKVQVVVGNETIETIINLPSAPEGDLSRFELIRHELNLTAIPSYSISSVLVLITILSTHKSIFLPTTKPPQIKTFWCDGEFSSTFVNGTCFADLSESFSQNGLIILAALLLIVFIGLGVASFIVSKRKRNFNDKHEKKSRETNIAYLEIDTEPVTPRIRFHTYEEINDYVNMLSFTSGNSGNSGYLSLYEHMENAYEQPIPSGVERR